MRHTLERVPKAPLSSPRAGGGPGNLKESGFPAKSTRDMTIRAFMLRCDHQGQAVRGHDDKGTYERS